MHPLFDCSVPHPYKKGERARPRDAVRLPVPGDISGLYAWVTPAFFAYAQATPGWYAAEVLRDLEMTQAVFGYFLDDTERPHPDQPGVSGMGLGGAAAKGGSHD